LPGVFGIFAGGFGFGLVAMFAFCKIKVEYLR
jgi:hypothetical protein